MTSAARSGPAPAGGVPSAQARRGGTGRLGSGRASGGGDTGLLRRLLRLQSSEPWAPEVPGRRDARGQGEDYVLGTAPRWGLPAGWKGLRGPPLRPVGVPAPPAWRVPECNRTCRWGNRGGWCGAQPLTGGTVSTAVGVLQPGTTEQGGEASVPCAVALTRPVVGPLGRTCVNGGVCLLCTRVSRFGRGQIGI